MANLSSAIIDARKRHEAEIAERLRRRQQRQRAELERLNALAVESVDDSAPQPQLAARPVTPQVAESATPIEAPVSFVDTQEPVPARADVAAVETPPTAPVAEPPGAVQSAVVAPPPSTTRPVAPPPPPSAVVARPEQDELETLPDGRFLRLRNDIIDRIKPYLTGNQFAVYLEIYRQTVGRGRTGGWFRTRDVQAACNLGSDNTVRDAYPVLEQKRLIKLDPNRRVGSPRGLYITVLSVERALERLERGAGTTPRSVRAARVAPPAPGLDEAPAVPSDAAGLIETLTRAYGVSPTVAPGMLDLVRHEDRALVPYLLRRLDRSIAGGKVHNPAGLLRVWLESFDTWRPELEAERRLELEAARVAERARSRDELMLEWFRETEATVQAMFEAIAPDEDAAMREEGRAELLARSPAVLTWSDAQWDSQLDTYVKTRLRQRLDPFEVWLDRRVEA